MNDLLLRKQLLTTEAELHREHICQDIRIIGHAIDGFGRKAKSVGAAVSVITLLAGSVAAFRGVHKRKSPNNGHRPSMVSRLFSGVRLASTMWRGWKKVRG